MNLIRDIIEQLWTLLGMFIAWAVLDGSARTVVGYAIAWTLTVWVLTFRLRNPREKETAEDTQ